MENNWKAIKLKKEAELLRKEQYVYRITEEEYQVELFETAGGKYYAIGQPVYADKLTIYGSGVVDTPQQAIEQTLRKIDRDATHREVEQVGEDVHHDESTDEYQ